ncbi:MAG: hypothetical protein KVP17_001187 [Porospora cf. gigantea B]|uniref:uncharacterized protein n=1 Tax=Porospora cf. gigantea B TaxID=2853592 RepID=UPI003571E1F3|nr:MAG: hypothetical protein KVP17_001187 [Porospora cf. gigantea B]
MTYLFFLVFPLQLLAAVLLYNYTYMTFQQKPHTGIDSSFVLDIFFAEEPTTFFFQMPPVMCFTSIYVASAVIWQLLFAYTARHIERMVPHVATAISYGILFNELFRNIICFTSILCVLLWVFVSLLVNGPLFLPTATVVGLGAFLMYRVRYHFETARTVVREFIEEYLQRIVAIAIENWTDKSQTKIVRNGF